MWEPQTWQFLGFNPIVIGGHMSIKFTEQDVDKILIPVLRGKSSKQISEKLDRSESWVKELRLTQAFKERRSFVVDSIERIMPSLKS